MQGDYQVIKNTRQRKLEALAQQVYDININPDPRVLCTAMLELRGALLQVIRDLNIEVGR